MPTQSENLESADSMAITFKMQKNQQKHDTVIHSCFVPRTSMNTSCEQNLDISSYISGYSGVHIKTPLHVTHHLQEHPSALTISLQHS
jgi:hypothetical protein